MNNTYTVISFGNYETKILVCNYINNKLFPVYKTSFLTNNCIDNSVVTDTELLSEIINNYIKEMPIPIEETRVIFNIPVKSIVIKNHNTDEMLINGNLNSALWDKITKNIGPFVQYENKKEFNRKFYRWQADGVEYFEPPIDKKIKRLIASMKSYFVDVNLLRSYYEVFYKLNLKNTFSVTCDSFVIHEMFLHESRKNKLLLNIGHIESSIEFFRNSILFQQIKIPFGIKDLTSKICDSANIPEDVAINLLKIYRDVSKVDVNLPLINHFKQRFSDYTQTLICDINKFIKIWLDDLVKHLNKSIDFLTSYGFVADEMYIYSSTDIFDSWINKIKTKLTQYMDIIRLESKMIGVQEPKFISLIASILHVIDKK